jgi:glyoxylase-like metal-dependent hydrolase (beta-lactamase superfamily II)
MINIKSFVCNPYQENSYLLYDDSLECAIIDPGMYDGDEQNRVLKFIAEKNLKPVLLLNTHCHIDHVLGNRFIHDTYGLLPQFHQGEQAVLNAVVSYAPQMGIRYDVSPLPETYLSETGTVSFGESKLNLIFCPGHSPAHLCFHNQENKILIGGDVLFYQSIGRTDLPGGNHDQLITNIREKIFALEDDCRVYPGHGQSTMIGYEKQFNPFLT